MTEPGWLVTGAARSGTGYLATVLRGSGLNVGHEQWWGIREQIPGLDGDVSWLGCFDDGYCGPVYAQVRSPLAAIPSIHAARRHPWSLVWRVTVAHTGDDAVDAALVWLRYTRRAVDRARSWWRVEDVTAGDLYPLGGDTAAALASVRHDVNTRPAQPYTWPDHPVIDRCLALAAELGYMLDDTRS